jgi:hypothetical protein
MLEEICVWAHENVHRGEIDCSTNKECDIMHPNNGGLPWKDGVDPACSEARGYLIQYLCARGIKCSACKDPGQCEIAKKAELTWLRDKFLEEMRWCLTHKWWELNDYIDDNIIRL